MTDPEHDEAFEAYLKRRSVLPHFVDDRLEPPVALDQIVLSRARTAIEAPGATKTVNDLDAVEGEDTAGNTAAHTPAAGLARATTTPTAVPTPSPIRKPIPRAPRWAVPVALAATLLLCLSVVMNVSLNTNRPSPNLQRMTAARADYKASGTADALDAASGANHNEPRQSVSGDIPSNEVILPEAKVAGAKAPRSRVQAESASAAPPPADPALAAPASAPPTLADEPRVAAKSAADKAALFAKRAGASAPGSAPVPTLYPAASAGAAAPAASSPGRSEASATHPADPKVWLQQIDALRAAGKTGQADAEMQRFRATFPGYVAKPAPPASTDAPK